MVRTRCIMLVINDAHMNHLPNQPDNWRDQWVGGVDPSRAPAERPIESPQDKAGVLNLLTPSGRSAQQLHLDVRTWLKPNIVAAKRRFAEEEDVPALRRENS